MRFGFLVVAALATISAPLDADGWKAGVARTNITPERPIWMSGYASRSKPADGKLHDLWAKALVIEDAAGRRLALVTLDLIGLDRDTAREICRRVERQWRIPRPAIMLAASHTHTGPVVGKNLAPMFAFTAQQRQEVTQYTNALVEHVVAAVGQAGLQLEPVDLVWGLGTATFAVNRRNNKEADVEKLRADGTLRGPVDHSVPVLAVRAATGRFKAIVFGYACHCTVLDSYGWSGDYAGFAQLELEQRYPGATALFWAGCGGDQNPLPRRRVELAKAYGKQLADSVTVVLASQLTPILGRTRAEYVEVALPYAALPTKTQLGQAANGANRYEALRAKHWLEHLQQHDRLPQAYEHYPVQVWKLGNEVIWIALGGEVVVDYALRIKRELPGRAVFVTAYANDVMAYIPSRRVLEEGGYEGGGAMVYYGLPSPWGPRVEDIIVDAVQQLVRAADRLD